MSTFDVEKVLNRLDEGSELELALKQAAELDSHSVTKMSLAQK